MEVEAENGGRGGGWRQRRRMEAEAENGGRGGEWSQTKTLLNLSAIASSYFNLDC